VEGKYNLGAWVIVQRYRQDDLSEERKKRLDKIGFVWNWRDFAWQRGFSALLKFSQFVCGHSGSIKTPNSVSSERVQASDLKREHLIEQVCVQEILPPDVPEPDSLGG
jgi:hypothetical protein